MRAGAAKHRKERGEGRARGRDQREPGSVTRKRLFPLAPPCVLGLPPHSRELSPFTSTSSNAALSSISMLRSKSRE